MKKYLAMLCSLMILTAFASCGDSPENSSEPSSSISESATEEITTESETPKEEITLDSEWECKYLKIAKSSEWEETIETKDDKIDLNWMWGDKTSRHSISLILKTPSEKGKMSKEDLQEKYSKTGFYTIFDTFEKNGQAYIITSTGGEDYVLRNIYFSTDEIDGKFIYTSENEDVVMDIIDTIEFNDNLEKITKEVTEPTTIEKVKNKKFTVGDLFFELPEICEEHEHEQNENSEYFLYELEGPSVLQIRKIFDDSFIDFYYSDNEIKQFTLENFVLTSDAYKDFEKLGKPEIININSEIIVKQEMMTKSESGDIYSTLYGFVYNNHVYFFHFSFLNENDVQSHIMQDEIIKSISFNESPKITDEKTNESQESELTNSFEPFTISGTGSTVIKDVNIPAEFVVYNAIHTGESNFIARFYDCNDDWETLANEIGNYSCTQILDATDLDDSSSGLVEIDADGDWSITFSPVKSVVNNKTSTSFSGYGADITGAFESTGNMVCTVSHNGTSNFIVHAYELKENGDREPVANEIGEYNGQSIIKTKKDTLYFFNVEADGNWTIEVE